jgi:predicted small secreted protein
MANIIGEVFDEYVKNQINERQFNLGLNLATNDDSLNQWKFNNSAWVRMVSSVDISSEKASELKLSGYEGSKLAKNFILYNGVSSVTGSNDDLYFNPSTNNSEYFINNKDFSIKNSYGFGGLNQGIRPMPGIDSVKVGYINRGFLAQVEIEITAFNREQLYILDALFMHPGYTFLLEWGHTRYIDNNSKEIIHIDPTSLITPAFSKLFQTKNINSYDILNSIKNEREVRSGNYDGQFLVVKKFKYTYQPNGTYKISITGVNQGDIIENLKINTVDAQRASSTRQKALDKQTRDKKIQELTNELNRLNGYFDKNGVINSAGKLAAADAANKIAQELTNTATSEPNLNQPSPNRSLRLYDENQVQSDNLGRNSSAVAKRTQEASIANYVLITETWKKRQLEIDSEIQNLTGENLLADNLVERYAGKSKLNKQLSFWRATCNKEKENLPDGVYGIKTQKYQPPSQNNESSGGGKQYTDYSMYYIRLGSLLNWIKNNLLLYDKTISNPYVNIDTNYNTNFCLHFPKQVSANPNICVIPVKDGNIARKTVNEVSASNSTLPVESSTTSSVSNSSDIFYGALPSEFSLVTSPSSSKIIDESFLHSAHVGKLMYIDVNLDFIAATVNDNIDEDGNLSLISFLKELLKGISAALGYINNFEVIYDRENNQIKIFDNNVLKYSDLITKTVQISEFVVNGFENFNLGDSANPQYSLFGSFIESVDFTTELSNNFSNMVTVASQADTNVLGMDVTGFTRFNKGLEDRIIKTKQTIEEINNNGNGLSEEELSKLLTTAKEIVNEIWGLFNISESDIDILMSLNRDIANFYVNKAAKKGTIPSPLVIPFNLSLKMMGISGMRILERFNVDTKILPPMFDNNKYNFIVKAITHEIVNNKWNTILESQVINKDNSGDKDEPISNIQRESFQARINTGKCPSWAPKNGGTPVLLTPNQIILSSLKDSGYITTANFDSFKSSASPAVKFASIIATQEGYGKTSTLGYRNNNPGNIVGSGNAGSETKIITRGTKPEKYTYAKYKTKKDGWDALINKFVQSWINQGNLLPYTGCTLYPDCFKDQDNTYFKQNNIPIIEGTSYNYKAKQTPTLRQYIYQFCPPSATGTDTTNGYIANVYKSLKSFGLDIKSIDEPMTNYIK